MHISINMMKYPVLIWLLLVFRPGYAQEGTGFFGIDYRVQSVEPATAGVLAHILTAPYKEEKQKVRAIFSWIAYHIEYKTKKLDANYNIPAKTVHLQPMDSGTQYSANEYVAELVLSKQSAVCEGYARLFKTLCDDAGIQSVLITGYARGDMHHFGKSFISNHYWNAVYVDSAWHLIDVTWASGYFTYFSKEFIKHFDDDYFFTPPEIFARDHFPDDLQWTLLKSPQAPEEFNNSPFKQRAFIKYRIISFQPLKGVIEASVGDTIRFSLESADSGRDNHIAADTVSLDSSMLSKYESVVFLEPLVLGEKIIYEYIVNSTRVEWVHLLYNHDTVLRYKLKFKKAKSDPESNWKTF
jgi:hypothetical protein